MKIGIYGGTFSPVHNGHVRAAKLFLDNVPLDKLLIMPAGIPPHKAVANPIPHSLRLEMCKAAFIGLSPIVEVSDFEMKKQGKSYTVETVEHFSSCGEIYVLCGEDMICSLDNWYRAEELMKMATFVAIARKDGGRSRVIEAAKKLSDKYGAEIIVIDEEPLEISSTEIRCAADKGEDFSRLVPAEVLKIINENALYRQ